MDLIDEGRDYLQVLILALAASDGTEAGSMGRMAGNVLGLLNRVDRRLESEKAQLQAEMEIAA
ncbi:hypothetical protein FJU08_11600 [Martelella alba]|uniref:Uncharacterized protein n=2 Tax=Martelella alba TaxID=2590451 RepID=A0A506UEX3_9HYPH|nr:hypothetical protein FJU08_11600 [Martelella alba]